MTGRHGTPPCVVLDGYLYKRQPDARPTTMNAPRVRLVEEPGRVCEGCGETVSADVKPWIAEAYLTHPNWRCWERAVRKREQAAPEGGGA